MKQILLLAMAILLTACQSQISTATTQPVASKPTENSNRQHSLIIFYDSHNSNNKNKLLQAIKQYQAQIMYDYKNFSGVAIIVPANRTLEEAIAYFEKVDGVLLVNRNEVMHLL